MISWTLIPGIHVSGTISNRVLQLAPTDSSWIGGETVTLQATDSDGLSSQRSLACFVVNPDQWEQHNSDGTVTIVWSTGTISRLINQTPTLNAIVEFGPNANALRTEATSLLPADTLHQVRLLGIPSNQITFYQAINCDVFGNVVFQSPVDSFFAPDVQPVDVFRVTMINVRQGDSFLLLTPSGLVIVIDGGYGTHQPSFGGAWSGDGYPFALNYLQVEEIDQVDYMIETHHHMDHWGGLRDIQDAMPVSSTFPQTPQDPWKPDRHGILAILC